MKDDPNLKLAIDIAMPCAAWRRQLPGVDKLVRDAAHAALFDFETAAAELSIVLTDDAGMRALNKRWRGKDAPTNVLSFASGAAPKDAPHLLGDVVLALETVTREAREQGKPLADHVRHLIVHGVLHLRGHDHEASREAARMERLETRILAGLGVPDPYRVSDAVSHG